MPGWAWMLFGLGLGLAIAGIIYFSAAQRTGSAAPPAPFAPKAPAAASNAPQPRSEPDVPEDKTRYDFYDILPSFEVVIPERESAARTDSASKAVVEPGRYVLQTGSFTNYADADHMQAALALLGVEARIEKVTIDDDVFHRVRIGPLTDLEELNRIRERLRTARVEALLLKVP
jgi:cell division protein FtsN